MSEGRDSVEKSRWRGLGEEYKLHKVPKNLPEEKDSYTIKHPCIPSRIGTTRGK